VPEPLEPPRRSLMITRSRVRVFLGHLCTKRPENPSVASRVCVLREERKDAGLGIIKKRPGGGTHKQQLISIAAPARAPAPANRPHEPLPAAVLQPSHRPAVRVVRQMSSGPSACVLTSPVKCVRARASAAGSSSSSSKHCDRSSIALYVYLMCVRIDWPLHQ
jgi:hypothetical protein